MMQKSDLFAYLAAFVSIVLAVALTDMVQSAHRLLRARERVQWDALTPLLAATVFVSVLAQFFMLWGDARFEVLTFNGLLALMVVPTLYTFTAFAVLPDEVPERGIDLRQFYFDNRHYIVILLALASAGDVVRSLRWAVIHDMLDTPAYWAVFCITFLGTGSALAVIYVTRRWRWQFVAVVGLLVVTYGSYAIQNITPLG